MLSRKKRKQIQTRWCTLTACLNTKDGLLDKLFESEFYNMRVFNRIQSILDPGEQSAEVLKLITTEAEYQKFCDCLVATGQGAAVKKLLTVSEESESESESSPVRKHVQNESIIPESKTVINGHVAKTKVRAISESDEENEAKFRANRMKRKRKGEDQLVIKPPKRHRRENFVRISIYPEKKDTGCDLMEVFGDILDTYMDNCQREKSKEARIRAKNDAGVINVINNFKNNAVLSDKQLFVELFVNTIRTHSDDQTYITFYVPIPDLTALEMLMKMYTDGRLRELVNELFLTEDIREDNEAEDLKMMVQFPREDYLECHKHHADTILLANNWKEMNILPSGDVESVGAATVQNEKHQPSEIIDTTKVTSAEAVQSSAVEGGELLAAALIGNGASCYGIDKGSILVHLKIPTIQALDSLKKSIDSGKLQSVAQASLIKPALLKDFSLDSAKIAVSIDNDKFRELRKGLSKKQKRRRNPDDKSGKPPPHKRPDVVRIILNPEDETAKCDMTAVFDDILDSYMNNCEEMSEKESDNEMEDQSEDEEGGAESRVVSKDRVQQVTQSKKDKRLFADLFMSSLRIRTNDENYMAFYVPIRDLSMLDHLRSMHTSGALQDLVNDTFLTKGIRDEHDLGEFIMKAEFPQDDYQQCLEYLQEKTVRSKKPGKLGADKADKLTIKFKITEVIMQGGVSEAKEKEVKAAMYKQLSKSVHDLLLPKSGPPAVSDLPEPGQSGVCDITE